MSATPHLDREWLAAKKKANAAFDARDAVGMLEGETLADLISRKRDFVEHAIRLANALLARAADVEERPLDHHTLNSLGEIQNSGTDIDRLCVEIGALREVLAGVGSARKAAAREGA